MKKIQKESRWLSSTKIVKVRKKECAHSNYPKSKGQLFVLAAIIMVSGIIFIYNVLGTPSITEEKRFQDTRLLDKTAKNIMNEYIFAVGVATLSPSANESAQSFISSLSSYTRDEIDSNIFYAIAFVNGTNQKYSINLGNFLDRKINVTVNVTDSSPASNSASIDDKKNSTLFFSSNINGTINVTISYKNGNDDVVEKFSLTPSTRNFIMGFFDITIKDDGFVVNTKETYNRTWS